MPGQNLEQAKVREDIKSYAGIYDAGLFGGLMSVEFTEDSLIITRIAARNELNCIASSLEKNARVTVILPENGRIAFAGEAGAEFALSYR